MKIIIGKYNGITHFEVDKLPDGIRNRVLLVGETENFKIYNYGSHTYHVRKQKKSRSRFDVMRRERKKGYVY